jgi:hypothetical protein
VAFGVELTHAGDELGVGDRHRSAPEPNATGTRLGERRPGARLGELGL